MHHRMIRRAAAVLAVALAGCLILAGCKTGSSGGGAAAAQSVKAAASGPAAAEAKADLKGLEAACAPADPKTHKPVADPVATLLSSPAARHAFARCEELPRSAWPKAISCLITWGGKAHKALAAIPGYTSQLRDKLAIKVLNYCAATAKGEPAKQPVLS